MNTDQFKGALKQAAGKVQTQFGKITGSTGQQIKGRVHVVQGRAQQAVGDVKEMVRVATRRQ